MPVHIEHLYPSNPRPRNTAIHEIGLYWIIDSIIKKAHETVEMSDTSKLWNLRRRLWYFAYTDTKIWLLGDAITLWKEYRNKNNISLPLSHEDELTLIFYIYIYHEEADTKVQNIHEILARLGVTNIPNSLIEMCTQKPIQRRLYPEDWPNYSQS